MNVALRDPPDPDLTATAGDLVGRLNDLRRWAGQPSLRTLHRLGGTTVNATGVEVDALPTSTTSYLLNGRGLPRSPRLEFVEAYVRACLAAAGTAPERINPEVERWRVAWRSLVTAPPVPAPPVPAQHNGHGGYHFAPGPVDGTVTPAGRARRRRPGWLLVVALVALVAVAAVAGGLLARFGHWPGTGRAAAPPVRPAGPWTQVRTGAVPALADPQGIDFDTGQVAGQDAAGMDLTPWGQGDHLTALSGALLAVLDRTGPVQWQRCASVPAADYRQAARGLYALPAGTDICVWTRPGAVAMLVLDATPSQRSVGLSFHFVVWQPPG